MNLGHSLTNLGSGRGGGGMHPPPPDPSLPDKYELDRIDQNSENKSYLSIRVDPKIFSDHVLTSKIVTLGQKTFKFLYFCVNGL